MGLEVTAGLARQVQVRVGVNGGAYDDRREASDIEYDAAARVRAGTAVVDWHPGGGAFRVTGGAVYNGNEVEGESVTPASGVYDIGGVPVPAALVGRLRGKVEWDPVAPHAGFGWGNPLAAGRRWRVGLDLGVIFQGEPEVTLTPLLPPGSPLANPPARALLDMQLAKEERELEDEFSDYDLYPVVSLGISYRF